MEHRHHSTPLINLNVSPERRLIRSTGSNRYIAFRAKVDHIPTPEEPARLPLQLALVLDRSGSMQGDKLRTAKKAALAVLDRLNPRDSVSVVVFDSSIDTVQELAPVTSDLKQKVRLAFDSIEARASTALHEGWLTGCNGIARSVADSAGRGLARCFLLTDGIANVGVTDPERIASEAAGVREHTGISTSTFGIGYDYNELLLGPMAVAGGGQFHHLRSSDEMINTFVGELGALLSVAARQVRLEIEADRGVSLDLISSYWLRSDDGERARWSIAIGDLQSDEERQVVVRCAFPSQDGQQEQRILRARLVWQVDGAERATDWQDLRFSYAGQGACDDEPQDPTVMELVGLHEADRARREAVAKNNRGDVAGARRDLQRAKARMAPYALQSPQLQAEMDELGWMDEEMERAPMAPGYAKEVYYGQQRRSRGQTDYRGAPSPELPGDEKDKK